MLYVSNSLDGTVSWVDARAGRGLGAPVPAGAAPWRLAVGPAGSVLVQPVTAEPRARLTFLARAPGGEPPRPVSLEPGARWPLLAGGGPVAVVAYQGGERPAGAHGARCRLALVDLTLGRVTTTRDVCSGRDSVVDLAATGDGALVYVALWRRPVEPEACGVATGSRAVVLRLPPGGGPATPFAVLPDLAMGLAATDEHLYTLDVFGDRMWGLDRRRGNLVQTIPT